MVQMTIDEERVDEERKDTPLAERVIPIPYILAGGAVLVFLAALLCGHATARRIPLKSACPWIGFHSRLFCRA